MIHRVEIQNFRGIRSGGVAGLSALSIIVGPNNSGKSSLLEAVYALGAAGSPELLGQLIRRGGPPTDAIHRITTPEGAEVRGFDETESEGALDPTQAVSARVEVGGAQDPDHRDAALGEHLVAPFIPFKFHTRAPGRWSKSTTLMDAHGAIATSYVV